jgi:hypothetical protein
MTTNTNTTRRDDPIRVRHPADFLGQFANQGYITASRDEDGGLEWRLTAFAIEYRTFEPHDVAGVFDVWDYFKVEFQGVED